MPIHTRRWDDPPGTDEGLRILVTRYRPRGLPKSAETWDLWLPQLGPSKELHAAVYAKTGLGISWDVYFSRYRREMLGQVDEIKKLADRVNAGEIITLLCSSQCIRESRCHRSVLKELIERQINQAF
jgi:uncharacterized protein YeaO (DUF488 family)